MKIKSILTLVLILGSSFVYSQGVGLVVPEKKSISPMTEVWFGTYTKYRIRERLFYYGEYHLRRRNGFSDMGQIYMRVGLSYLVGKYFEVTAGVVNPYYWAPDPDAPNIDKIVPQFRGWQQFLFVMPFERLKLYHQVRTEQRFRRDFAQGSEFELTYRFRYKIMMYYPLTKPHLDPQTLFLSFYEEIFMQAGKSIIYDHFEDNRIYLGMGYIIDENWQLQTGFQWTFRHLNSPFEYQSRSIFRLSAYHNIDFFGNKK